MYFINQSNVSYITDHMVPADHELEYHSIIKTNAIFMYKINL